MREENTAPSVVLMSAIVDLTVQTERIVLGVGVELQVARPIIIAEKNIA